MLVTLVFSSVKSFALNLTFVLRAVTETLNSLPCFESFLPHKPNRTYG